MVLSGTMTIRLPDRFEVISKGDLVFFEMGETGAHQFYNHSSEPCTYLDIRTLSAADVAEHPDSGKINILPAQEIFDKDAKVGYFKGEDKIREKWEELQISHIIK